MRRVPRWCLVVAVGVGACGGDAPAAPRVESVPDKSGAETAPKAGGGTAGDPAAAAELVRASAAAPVTAKLAQHIGFEIATGLHAIEGTASTAPWGSSGRGDAKTVRDDDVLTGWSCDMGGAAPCAIGLGFTEKASVRAVVIYAAAGPKWNDYRAQARPKKVRVHTDAGFVEVAIDDGAAHKHVLFDKSVETSSIAVEVVDVHAGKKGKAVYVAELEVLGDRGPSRAPLELDPERTVVSFETDAWKAEGDNHTIRLAFLEEVQADGRLRRLMRGTAVHGRASDRFLVVEKLFGSSCTGTKGSYALLDRNTRVMLPLGELTGVPSNVALRADGTGALFTSLADPAAARAVVLDGDAIERVRPSKKKAETPEQLAARMNITAPPQRRGGHVPGAAPAGCKAGTSDTALVQRVATALGLGDAPPADASICELANSHRAIVGTSSGCGARWYAAVIGPAGEVVGEMHAKADDGRGAWFFAAPDVGVIFEATKDAGRTSDLLRLWDGGVQVLVAGGAIAVRKPKACDPCEGDFGAMPEMIPPDAGVADPEADDRGSPDGETPEARATDAVAPSEEPPAEPPAEPPVDEPPAKGDGKGLPTVTDEDPEE